MAHGDRKGPEGFGPMTGRGAGYCSGSGAPGYMNGMGRGRRGMGQGRGRGRRFLFTSNSAPFDEKEMLRKEAEIMKKNLEALQNRLNDLKDRAPSEE